MIACSPDHLKRAVAAVCPDIEERLSEQKSAPNERQLWWELSACLLSSRVPYELAVSAANAIDNKGLLQDERDPCRLSVCIEKVLRSPLSVQGTTRHYRFPKMRADQLAKLREVIWQEIGTLSELISMFENATSTREWLVANAPGIGPKQASMFLRNIGTSYDLAILDRHVLNYMIELGLCTNTNASMSALAKYKRQEAMLRSHAQQLACPVGILDWAIWIVMRAARSR